MQLSLVIFPNNTELNDALWNLDDIKSTLVIGVGLEERLERDRKLGQSLMELSGTFSTRSCKHEE